MQKMVGFRLLFLFVYLVGFLFVSSFLRAQVLYWAFSLVLFISQEKV